MDANMLLAIGSVAALVLILLVKFCCGSEETEAHTYRHESFITNESSLSRVDLHGMYRDDALVKVRNKLQEQKRAYRNGYGGPFIDIITGRGIHSPYGQPVIRPAVEEYLDNNGYSYTRKNDGMLRVDVR